MPLAAAWSFDRRFGACAGKQKRKALRALIRVSVSFAAGWRPRSAASTRADMSRQGSSLLKLLKFGAAALKPTKLPDGKWVQAAVSAKAAARLRKAALLEGKCVPRASLPAARALRRTRCLTADGRAASPHQGVAIRRAARAIHDLPAPAEGAQG